MDYQFWMGLAAIAVAVYAAYYQRKAVRLVIAQMPLRKRAGIVLPPWWHSPFIHALVVLVILCWIPYFMPYFVQPDIPNYGEDARAVTLWQGSLEPDAVGILRADGRYLMRYQDKYRLMGISLLHQVKLGNMIDSYQLQKSALYDIAPSDIGIVIRRTDTKMFPPGSGGTAFALLLVPKGIDPNSFMTIRQAQALGAKFLWFGKAD